VLIDVTNVDELHSNRLSTKLKDDGNNETINIHKQPPKHAEESAANDIVLNLDSPRVPDDIERALTPVEISERWDVPAKKVKKMKHRSASLWE
jgi:hypothetical protein